MYIHRIHRKDRIHRMNYQNIKPSDYAISTMTSTVYTNIESIDINKINMMYTEESLFKGAPIVIGENKRNFKNCIIIKFMFDTDTGESKSKKRTVSINVFRSGCFHVAGTRCEEEISSIIDFLYGHFIDNKIIDTGYTKVETEIKTRLINATFSIPLYNIDLNILYGKFKNDNPSFFVKYDSNNHPGVQIKVNVEDVDVSCFIFGSGKAIITGSKNSNQLQYVYEFITKYIDDNFNSICHLKPPVVAHVPQKRGRKRLVRDI